MKAISLHQPWATLVAIGAKTVETRGWATKYRGPLAIHASQRRLPMMHLPPLWSVGGTRAEQEEANRHSWMCINTITDPAHQRPHRTDIRDRVPRAATTPTLWYPTAGPHARPRWDPELGTGSVEQGCAVLCPLGAVVATCTLVDVVPTDTLPGDVHGVGWRKGVGSYYVGHDQLPLGDFRPGRYAWLLADVVPVGPVPAKGHQGLWHWQVPCCLCGPRCAGLDGDPPCHPMCSWCIHGCASPNACCLDPLTAPDNGRKVAP